VAIPELDVGPTATYCTFPIRGKAFDKYWDEIKGKSMADTKEEEGPENALFKTIRAHGFVRETPLIMATIGAFSRGEVIITKDKLVADNAGNLIEGYDLSREIDDMVRDKLPE